MKALDPIRDLYLLKFWIGTFLSLGKLCNCTGGNSKGGEDFFVQVDLSLIRDHNSKGGQDPLCR